MSIGQPLKRREDQRFLTGKGRYADNTAPTDALAVMFVRSSHAHALIVGIGANTATRIRAVTHLDVNRADIDAALKVISDALAA